MISLLLASIPIVYCNALMQERLPFTIVDTGQANCFDESVIIKFPQEGGRFFGQDAQYLINPAQYQDHGDGTVSDLVTGLMWTMDPGEKKTLEQAEDEAKQCKAGEYRDWRLPTIKELYSLIQFNGIDPGPSGSAQAPFLDISVFPAFKYGDSEQGERIIDAQFATSTRYVSTTMSGSPTMFGVNFADGRIKGYPIKTRRGEGRYYVMYVRGNSVYGENDFQDNVDGTVTDKASGLTWMKSDSKRGMNWVDALGYAEGLELAGHDDWRLPSAKELQSIVDYSRSPDTSQSAAINPVFEATAITNEGGEKDFAHYWSSTSHRDSKGASTAVYVAFGRALGFMSDRRSEAHSLLDVHGAGAQRSDPKTGNASRYPYGRGPQGDVIRIENMVRCVRGGNIEAVGHSPEPELKQTSKRDSDEGPSAVDLRRFIRRFDANGDGQVSPNEFDGPSRRFDRLDANGNGVITSQENIEIENKLEVAPNVEAELPLQSEPNYGGSPNFVLILTDDMGWTGLSVASDERMKNSRSDFYQTPNIARLATSGMRFSRAYSPAALCTPSRASILTGQTPARLHITTPGGGGRRAMSSRKFIGPRQLTEIPHAETTIAEVLSNAGYACAHLGKWHLGKSNPAEHGFDIHDGATDNGGPGAFQDPNPKDIFGMTERAIEFMEQQTSLDTPFYLQLSHYAMHVPVQALERSKEIFREVPAGDLHNNVDYAAMTYDLDSGVGQILDSIDGLGLSDNTYVVLMSDNGAAGSPRHPQNNPLSGGKGNFNEGGIRVPLIVRGPGIEPSSYCHENVIGYDLFPSFCEWAGVESSTARDGVSLLPLLQGQPEKFNRPQKALSFHFPHYGQGPKQTPQSAILVGNYKLIRDYEQGSSRLYNLESDIAEENDLAENETQKAAELEALLSKILSESNAQMPAENPDYNPSTRDSIR